MKKIYSTIMMLAMMVAALGVTACDSDDDNENNGGKTITIDGKAYYCYTDGSYVTQRKSGGMSLGVIAMENKMNVLNHHELLVIIPPSRVSELSVGQVFDTEDITVHTFNVLVIGDIPYSWDAIDGNIVIKDIKEAELSIQINNLVVKHNSTGIEHTIAGTATLINSRFDSKGNILPFSEF